MSVEQFGVRQGGMFVAKIDILSDEKLAEREAWHYVAMYQQDGPAELWRRDRHRHWRRLA
jgi:hypothetical protein